MKTLPTMFKVWNKRQKKMQEVVSIEFAASGQFIVTTEDDTLDDSDCVLLRNTGLHDKNGVEIYDGDIIHCTAGMRTPDKSFQTDERKVVTFVDGAFRYDGITLGDMVAAHMSEYTFEVIGNIWENPDLLPDSTERV